MVNDVISAPFGTSSADPSLLEEPMTQGAGKTNAGGGLGIAGLVGVVHIGARDEELEVVEFVCVVMLWSGVVVGGVVEWRGCGWCCGVAWL